MGKKVFKPFLRIQIQDKDVGAALQLARQLRELVRREDPEAYLFNTFTLVCAIQPAAAVFAEVYVSGEVGSGAQQKLHVVGSNCSRCAAAKRHVGSSTINLQQSCAARLR